MFEKHAVIGRFKDEVVQHLEVIESEIEKGNREEATLWLNELLIMKKTWETSLNTPNFAITAHSWVNPSTLDTGSTKHLAAERIRIVDGAIALVHEKFQAKGWST
tara:strand:- start:5746 stop:6060 length:315 start_codon:yes stop_codon:yes gene_type:complete